jgi:hypothetical protein
VRGVQVAVSAPVHVGPPPEASQPLLVGVQMAWPCLGVHVPGQHCPRHTVSPTLQHTPSVTTWFSPQQTPSLSTCPRPQQMLCSALTHASTIPQHAFPQVTPMQHSPLRQVPPVQHWEPQDC